MMAMILIYVQGGHLREELAAFAAYRVTAISLAAAPPGRGSGRRDADWSQDTAQGEEAGCPSQLKLACTFSRNSSRRQLPS